MKMCDKRKHLVTPGKSSPCFFRRAVAIAMVLCSLSIAEGQITSLSKSSPITQKPLLCEPGWTLKGESCYNLTLLELTWSKAQENCRARNSLLAEVEDAREQDALNDFLNSRELPPTSAWIGLISQQKENNWTWGSGRSMKYSNWLPSEPNNNGGDEHCVKVLPRESSRWNHYNCNQTFRGVCQKGYCGKGWTSTRKSCYQLTDEAKREAARAQCQSMHGSLVEINNFHEQEELHDFLKSQDAFKVWIGLSDPQKNGIWKWDSGSNLTYTKWIHGEPNNVRDQEYCVNAWQPYNYEWNDLACDLKYPAACKQHKDGETLHYITLPRHSFGGGTIAVAVSTSVGALCIVVITVFLWKRKPCKKYPVEQVHDERLSTYTHPNLDRTVQLQDHHIYKFCNSTHRTTVGLHERPETFTINEEGHYEELIYHSQNSYLDVQPI